MPVKPFAPGARIFRRTSDGSERTMKNVLPLFLALIPLAAMVGAYVVTP
jgi:hypothetical protein